MRGLVAKTFWGQDGGAVHLFLRALATHAYDAGCMAAALVTLLQLMPVQRDRMSCCWNSIFYVGGTVLGPFVLVLL